MAHKYDGVTVKQIDNMKHALGYEARSVKRKAYEAYRNHYTTSTPSKSWENLVELGLAEKRPFPRGVGAEPMIYAVSDAGIGFLSDLLGIKITESD